MLNRDGVRKYSYNNVRQILANVEFQESVGCIVPQEMGVEVTANGRTRKIVKAGTPVSINLEDINDPVVVPKAAAGGEPAVPMNAVLLHDVDVTDGAANGTACIFGFINLNRLENDVKTAITAATAIAGASPLLTFMAV
jgi:hypothetical protein